MAILLYYPCVIGSMKTAHYRPENYHGICNCFLARPVARKPHPEPRPELPPNVRNPREWPQFPNCNCRWKGTGFGNGKILFPQVDEWWEVKDFSGCVTSIEGGGISGIRMNLQCFHPGMPNSKELAAELSGIRGYTHQLCSKTCYEVHHHNWPECMDLKKGSCIIWGLPDFTEIDASWFMQVKNI